MDWVVCCLQASQEQAQRDGWEDKWNKYWEDPAPFERFLENRIEQRGEQRPGTQPPPFDTGVFEEADRQIQQHDIESQIQAMDYIAFVVWSNGCKHAGKH